MAGTKKLRIQDLAKIREKTRSMMAIRENEDRTKFLGYNTQKTIIWIFVISGVYGGVAGALLAAFNSFVQKEFTMAGLLSPALLAGLGLIILLTGFGAGLFPAFVLSSFEPRRLLRASTNSLNHPAGSRRTSTGKHY
jgi:branched-subunit amino acid ABC-type transport system permease component